MRPIDRGPAPAQPFADYRDAYPDLAMRLGAYCSFCERRLETHLAVEHVQPKASVPELRLAWDNFLLACHNCNSTKGDKDITLAHYLWPHRDNTLLAFRYDNGLVSNVFPSADPQHPRANALIRLVGLDKVEGHPEKEKRATASDKRRLRRSETWGKAQKARQSLLGNDTEAMRELIVELALSSGFFSIWFQVFADADMRVRLVSAFPGTASDCFDGGAPVPRPNRDMERP